MKSSLSIDQTIHLAEALEMGVRSGKDWTQVFQWISEHHDHLKMRTFCLDALKGYRVQSSQELFRALSQTASEPLAKILMNILVQGSRTQTHLSESLQYFIRISRRIRQLKRQQKSLLFLPKFQAGLALAIVLLFVGILPTLSPDMFPHFGSLGRIDLLAMGLCGVAIGFGVLWLLAARPQRQMNRLLETQFFLFFMSILVRSGHDIVSAWRESLGSMGASKALHKLWPTADLRITGFKSFLQERSSLMPPEIARILTGLVWIIPTGIGLSDYLQAAAESETERMIFEWEDELRKLGAISVLPLSLIIFPSALFLLIGPQVLGAFSL